QGIGLDATVYARLLRYTPCMRSHSLFTRTSASIHTSAAVPAFAAVFVSSGARIVKHWPLLSLAGGGLCVLLGVGLLIWSSNTSAHTTPQPSLTVCDSPSATQLVVDVAGGVVAPGVY